VEEVKARPQHPPLLEELLSRAVADMNAAEVIESSGDSDEEREAEDWLKRRRDSERHVPGPPKPPPERPSTPSRRSLGQALNTARSLCGKDKVSDVILLFYERLAQREEIEAEKVKRTEKISPSTVSLWEVGEDLPKLDWTSSLLRSGVVIPGVTSVTRDWEEETIGQEDLTVPWIEIYIDSSGSMPDPTLDFSPLAFAGFLLAKSAVQAGSKVRIIQYSGCKQVQAMKDFTSSLRTAFPALLKYFGDGTDFPFPVLEDSVNRFRGRAPVARVFITDSDFLMNVQRSSYKVDPWACLEEACRESTRVMAILNLGSIQKIENLSRLLATGLKVVSISDWAELTGVAIRISEGLFPKAG
jgi:hypothetical protein